MMKRISGYILSIMMTLMVIGCCHMDFYEELIISVTGVKLDKEALELVEGDSYQLTATVAPANAHNKKVTWKSSDESIATVDQNGMVTAIKEGAAVITVTTEDGGKTATCTVTVTAKEDPTPDPEPDPDPDPDPEPDPDPDPIPVVGVTLDKTELALIEGETDDLVATVTPDDADNKNVTWSSSDESIATVDQNGKVTAIKEGTAIITVTTEDGGKTATCTVTVTAKEEPLPDPIPVDGVTLDIDSMELEEGETGQLTATVTPDDADNKNVTWSSSDESIATVDQNGKVTAIKEGTAIITVTTEDGGKTATCTVTVTAKEDPTPDPDPEPDPDPDPDPDLVPVTGVKLNTSYMVLMEGEIGWLRATVTPSDADNKNVIWSSSDEDIATVDQNGKVTAIREGTIVITVTTEDGGKTATCTVVVIGYQPPAPDPIHVTGVSLNKNKLELKEEATETLIATITPANADDKSVTWSSDHPEVATVNANGKVTAVKAGSCTITVKTNDGGKTATCEVIVIGDVNGEFSETEWENGSSSDGNANLQ